MSYALFKIQQPKNDYFEIFWRLYPRKVAKKKCAKIWKRLKVGQKKFENIMFGLRAHIRKWIDPKYIPHPSTFLNQERWADGWIVESRKLDTGGGENFTKGGDGKTWKERQAEIERLEKLKGE